jgi:hypothetical protein
MTPEDIARLSEFITPEVEEKLTSRYESQQENILPPPVE